LQNRPHRFEKDANVFNGDHGHKTAAATSSFLLVVQATMPRKTRFGCTLLLLLLKIPLAASFSPIIAGPITTTTMTLVKSLVAPSSPSTTRPGSGPWHRLWMAADNQDDDNSNDESKSISKSNSNSNNNASPLMNHKLFTTIGKSTSAVVAGTFYIVLAIQRDALMISFFIGAISNGILSKVLKKLLQQARPEALDTTEMELKPSDNGMPSSHAMSLGFIGTFTALCLPWTSLFLMGYVVLSLMYRVESKLHTLDQVLVGASVGSLNGYLWFLYNINLMDFVTKHFLNEQGLLPLWGLAVPALLGAAIVGSVERRISRFLKQREPTTKQE
jgi:membrane-associated phospholipid phosphatase